MKHLLSKVLLSAVLFAGVSANAQAQDCGMRDREFWGLQYAIQSMDKHDAKINVLNNVLKTSAISTSQAIEIVKLFDKKQDDVAVSLYHAVCDSRNWNNIYSIPALNLKHDKIEREIKKYSPRNEDFNRKHHADWYNGNGNNNGWGNNGHNNAGHNNGHNNQMNASLQAELDRQKSEAAALRAELERIRAAQQQAAVAQQISDAYKRGYDEGYRRGYEDSRIDAANACVPMNSASFNSFLTQLKEASFKSDKESVVKMVAKSNRFTCEQVKQVIKLMSYKISEEMAAVTLYPVVCDRENWFSVYSAFTFSSSANEVNKQLGI